MTDNYNDMFKNHILTFKSEDRWVIQTLQPDGKPSYHLLTEVIVGRCGMLYVGGDIDTMAFGHNNSVGAERVHWIGMHKLDHYVVEKATIGTSWSYCHTYDQARAEEDLKAIAKDYEDDPDLVQCILNVNTDRGQDIALEELNDLIDDVFEYTNFGMRPSTSVKLAHAALCRLSELLRSENGTTTTESA